MAATRTSSHEGMYVCRDERFAHRRSVVDKHGLTRYNWSRSASWKLLPGYIQETRNAWLTSILESASHPICAWQLHKAFKLCMLVVVEYYSLWHWCRNLWGRRDLEQMGVYQSTYTYRIHVQARFLLLAGDRWSTRMRWQSRWSYYYTVVSVYAVTEVTGHFDSAVTTTLW
jgi:hypothetical protein